MKLNARNTPVFFSEVEIVIFELSPLKLKVIIFNHYYSVLIKKKIQKISN